MSRLARTILLLPWRREIDARERSNASALRPDRCQARRPGPAASAAGHAARPASGRGPATGPGGQRQARRDWQTAGDKEKAEAEKSAGPATLQDRIHEKAEEIKEKVDGVLESPFARHSAPYSP